MAYETVDIASLKPHPKNYRKHGKDQIEHIVESIKTNKQYRNVVIASDNVILAGHGVVEALKKLEIKQASVFRLPFKSSDPKAMKVLTGDNEIARLGEVDDRMLTDILKDLSKDADLLGTGFDDMMLANLVFVTRSESEIPDFDAAKAWVGLPEYDEKGETFNAEPVIVISFKNETDRERFVKETNLKIGSTRGGRKWSTTWPYVERDDLKSVKFETSANA